MEVASQVVVLNHGRIEQQGAPSDIYDHPSNAFVSRFIGQTNIFDIEEIDPAWLKTSGLSVENGQGQFAHVRPHDIEVNKSTDVPQVSGAYALLKDWQHLGSLIRIELVENSQQAFKNPIYAEMPNERFKQLQLDRGDKVAVKIRNARWFH